MHPLSLADLVLLILRGTPDTSVTKVGGFAALGEQRRGVPPRVGALAAAGGLVLPHAGIQRRR